ncbi:MAG: hypothetical protein ACYTFH_09530, partial [Planctomycetota bacterium]
MLGSGVLALAAVLASSTAATTAAAGASDGSVALAENGVSTHRIVIPVAATAVESLAAERLAYYIAEITGATL